MWQELAGFRAAFKARYSAYAEYAAHASND
jgi:hypothetical protein